MKKLGIMSLLVLVTLIALATSAFAATNAYTASPGSKTVERGYAVNPALVAAGENAVFDKLVKKALVSVSTTAICCPADNVSTNSAAIAYMDDVIPPFRLILSPYDSATASLTYDIYGVDASGTIVAPDTTCLLPITNGKYDKVFFSAPNVVFGANAVGTMTLEVWQPGY